MSNEYLICVDDDPLVVKSLKQELHSDPFFFGMHIEITDNPQDVEEIVREILADGGEIPAVISDQRMPGMSGSELFIALKPLLPNTHNILLTGFADLDAVITLVNDKLLYHFHTKPWEHEDLLLTIKSACISWRQKKQIAALTRRIENLTHAMVTAFENANLFFDEETGQHIHRIAFLSEFVGSAAGLDPDFISIVKLYSPLHDIGKVGIRKDILFKPGALTNEEFEHIKEHVQIGYRIIDNKEIDGIAKNIVLYHHEKWSGKGYLAGLNANDIPLEARIVSIADVFDALVNKRVYKNAMPYKDALDLMYRERGISFDPILIDSFVEAMSRINYRNDLYITG